MIFILTDEAGSVQKVAQKAAEKSELLRAVNLAALRARARKLEAGDVIRMIGGPGDNLTFEKAAFKKEG